jgi:hypothetical protein
LVELNEQSKPLTPVDLKTLINEFKSCKDSIELLTNEHALLGINKTNRNILEQINQRISILEKTLTRNKALARFNESAKNAAKNRRNTKITTGEMITKQYNIWDQTFENLQDLEETNINRFESEPCLLYSTRLNAQSSYERLYRIVDSWVNNQNDLRDFNELKLRFESLLFQIERRANSSANYAWYAKQACEF